MSKTILISVAVLALAACSGSESGAAPAPSAGTKSAPTLELPALPTQDEADAQAEKSINEKNAEAEFEKLKKELDGG